MRALWVWATAHLWPAAPYKLGRRRLPCFPAAGCAGLTGSGGGAGSGGLAGCFCQSSGPRSGGRPVDSPSTFGGTPITLTPAASVLIGTTVRPTAASPAITAEPTAAQSTARLTLPLAAASDVPKTGSAAMMKVR
jgi:hypothetical protein